MRMLMGSLSMKNGHDLGDGDHQTERGSVKRSPLFFLLEMRD